MFKKVIISLWICILCFTPVYADEEQGTNLDLKTENTNQNNEASLTDQNQLPLFTDAYKNITRLLLDQNDIFIGKEVHTENQELVTSEELFSESSIIEVQVKEIEKSNSIYWIYGIIGVILVVISAISMNIYLQRKKRKEKSHDTYFYG